MIRRMLVIFAVLAATVVLATPVSAAGATSSTQNFHGAFPPFHVDSTCGAPAGTISGTGNAVFHITVITFGQPEATDPQSPSISSTT